MSDRLGIVSKMSPRILEKPSPYIFNYNANVQQQLFRDTVMQVSYVGSQGRRLYRVRDINQATPGPAATRQLRRPFNTQFPNIRLSTILRLLQIPAITLFKQISDSV